MSERFVLHYWPLPFRGHFPRFVLAHAGVGWDEPGVDRLTQLRTAPVRGQPVPFMAPPLLEDRDAGVALAQMPAIMAYLGSVFGLMPDNPAHMALTLKVLGDCTDVIEEITCHCGAAMWTDAGWAGFAGARLVRWLEIFEDTGLRPEDGTLLGSDTYQIADLACAALWHTMADKLPALAPHIARHAPTVAALSARVADTPAIAGFRRRWDAAHGAVYCGGEIEASLREVLGRWPEASPGTADA